ncbi:MAG: B12-binding domain-containing radical SAM protein [Magnetococcales bacterium]|nr:B12-binding domain-containing radical SAM protein [Magnetococcales bacterium]
MNPLSTSPEAAGFDLGLGYLAATLREAGHEPDLLLRPLTAGEFREHLRRHPPGLVGIKILAAAIPDARRTIAMVRETLGAPVVVGGPQVTGDPLGILDALPADLAIQGDGDWALPALVSSLAAEGKGLEAVPGLVRREGEGLRVNPLAGVDDLDRLPYPAWDLMPPARHATLVAKRLPAASLLITRGCSHQCTYCAEGIRPLRFRSVENVMGEIRLLVERFGVREIQFLDSNFLFNRRYIKRFCQAVLDSGLDLVFSAPNGMRIESLDAETAMLLGRIGLYRVNLGIESGSREVLEAVNKRVTPEVFRDKVPLLRRHGVEVVGNFMVGFPGETRAQMEESLALALELDLTGLNVSVYTPMPGTELHRDLLARGRLPPGVAPGHNYVNYENTLSELAPAELRRFRNRFALRFLLRWRMVPILWRLLRHQGIRRTLFRRIGVMYLRRLRAQARAGEAIAIAGLLG